MTSKKVTLTWEERKARFVERAAERAAEDFELVCPRNDDAIAVFSTESRDLWPRRATSKRHARDLIKRVPGHVREGEGPTTIWRVEAEAFFKHYTKLSTAKAPPPEAVTQADDEIADLALENAGLRPTTRRSA